MARPFSAQCQRPRCETVISLSGLRPIYNPFTTTPCGTCATGVHASRSSIIKFLPASSARFPPALRAVTVSVANESGDCQQLCREWRGSQHARSDDHAHRRSMPKDAIFGRFSYNNSRLYVTRQTFGGAQLPNFGDNDSIITTRLHDGRRPHLQSDPDRSGSGIFPQNLVKHPAPANRQ